MTRENVAIIGAYSTKFGELWEHSWKDIARQAGIGALKDANVERHLLDEVYVADMGLGISTGQNHLGPYAYELFFNGEREKPLNITHVKAACASGSKAIEQAYNSILAGLYQGKRKIVLVGGVEKMRNVKGEEATRILGSAANAEEEISLGKSFVSLYGEMANRYMYETGAKEEDMHMVSVIDHKNASKNPKAHYPFPVTLEDVKTSSYVAEPLRLLDCSGISDGAAAIILAPESLAKEIGSDYVVIKAIESNTDTISLHRRKDITSLRAAKRSAERAYKEVGLSPRDVWDKGVFTVHNCFSIAGLIACEDLGLTERGEGYKFIREVVETGSEEKFNPSGGLKAKGHPVGATGVAQIVELDYQLRGKAYRQVEDIEYGLAHNVGGTGGTAVVTILGR